MKTAPALPSHIRLFTASPGALDMADIIRASKRAGSHFFDADSMRYFGSRIPGDLAVFGGGLFAAFVTSEKRPRSKDPRAYTVRVMDCFGELWHFQDEEHGGAFRFQCHSTLAKARKVMARMAGDALAAELCRRMQERYADKAAGLRREAEEVERFAKSL